MSASAQALTPFADWRAAGAGYPPDGRADFEVIDGTLSPLAQALMQTGLCPQVLRPKSLRFLAG